MFLVMTTACRVAFLSCCRGFVWRTILLYVNQVIHFIAAPTGKPTWSVACVTIARPIPEHDHPPSSTNNVHPNEG